MGIKDILELAVFAAGLAQKLLNENRDPTKEELDALESRLDRNTLALRKAAGRA
jgi:hypothetical protein